ncbi:MAG: glycosyltransferase family 9 protein [Bdellovibrionota bacterium]
MKILVLQLARFGDILITGPVLKSLRRKYPDARIDFLVRSKFKEAAGQLEGFDRILELSTVNLIGPIIQEEMNEGESIRRAHAFVDNLKYENYDEIINLSFSPASSYLMSMLETDTVIMRGYGRHEDGSFKILDEASEYFYAQVGVGQHNRFHLINILASVAGVDVLDSDLTYSFKAQTPLAVTPGSIAIHIGASQEGKRIPVLKWISFIREFGEIFPNTPLILLGAGSESEDAEKIAGSSSHAHLYNYVGKTKWSDVFGVLAKCKMLVAADSSLVHAAGLVGTSVFNISNPTVNFWETGPRSPGSFVYFENDFEMLNTRDLAQTMTASINGFKPANVYIGVQGIPAFDGPMTGTEFQWDLIAALYWGADFPRVNPAMAEAVAHLQNLNDVVLENLANADKIDPKILAEILKRADDIQMLISQQMTDLQPLFRFMEVERIRIAPGTREEIIKSMITCHERCAVVLQVFLSFQVQEQKEMADGQL